MQPIWTKLSQAEQDRLYGLMQLTKPYLSWCSMSKTQQQKNPFDGHVPTDQEWIEMDGLSQKMWI